MTKRQENAYPYPCYQDVTLLRARAYCAECDRVIGEDGQAKPLAAQHVRKTRHPVEVKLKQIIVFCDALPEMLR